MAARWPPRTEVELQQAAAVGALQERQSVEVKRELAQGSQANIELAADLASLAVRGGLLIFGIDESAGFALTPIPLNGLAERIELVGRSRVDEPLELEFIEIETAADRTRGYLIVQVPLSPRAPHMVGNKYWGRGDKTKYALSDLEVERLIERRTRWSQGADAPLREWVAREASAPENTANLFVVCVPVPLVRQLAVPLFQGGEQWMKFRELVNRADRPGPSYEPDLPDGLYDFHRRSNGWAGTRGLTAQRTRERQQGFLMELEITEDGILQLMYGRAADHVTASDLVVLEGACLGMTYRLIRLATIISEEARFLGNWDFGVAITGLKGAKSFLRHGTGLGSPIYDDDRYWETTRASREEARSRPGGIVERLLGRLTRAIGVENQPQLLELLGRQP